MRKSLELKYNIDTEEPQKTQEKSKQNLIKQKNCQRELTRQNMRVKRC